MTIIIKWQNEWSGAAGSAEVILDAFFPGTAAECRKLLRLVMIDYDERRIRKNMLDIGRFLEDEVFDLNISLRAYENTLDALRDDLKRIPRGQKLKKDQQKYKISRQQKEIRETRIKLKRVQDNKIVVKSYIDECRKKGRAWWEE